MRKYVNVLMFVCLAAFLGACGGDSGSDEPSKTDTQKLQQEAEGRAKAELGKAQAVQKLVDSTKAADTLALSAKLHEAIKEKMESPAAVKLLQRAMLDWSLQVLALIHVMEGEDLSKVGPQIAAPIEWAIATTNGDPQMTEAAKALKHYLQHMDSPKAPTAKVLVELFPDHIKTLEALAVLQTPPAKSHSGGVDELISDELLALGCPQCAKSPDAKTTDGDLRSVLTTAQCEKGTALDGCTLPESLRSLPAGLRGAVSPRTIILINGWLAKIKKVEAIALPEHLSSVKTKAVAEHQRMEFYATPALFSGDGTDKALASGYWVDVAPNLGKALTESPNHSSLLFVGPKEIALVQSSVASFKDGKLTWASEVASGERWVLAKSAALADPAKREAALRQATRKLTEILSKAEENMTPCELEEVDCGTAAEEKKKKRAIRNTVRGVIIDARTRSNVLSDAAEILKKARINPGTDFYVPSPLQQRSIDTWFMDSGKAPEGFDGLTLNLRRGREFVRVSVRGAAVTKINEAKPSFPDGVKLILVRSKTPTWAAKVPVGSGADAHATLIKTVATLEQAAGEQVQVLQVDGRNQSAGKWQPLLSALVGSGEQTKKLALRLYAPPAKEKAVAPPKPPPAKIGYCKKSDIAKVMKRRAGSFRFCYQRRLQMNPGLKGRVSARFTIGEDGKVVSAKIVKADIPDRKVPSCVAKNIKKLRFPRPQGGQCVVNWPFTFQPK